MILFQETLKYQDAMNLCYGRQETMELHHASDAHIWAICKVIMEIMIPIVKRCIFY